MKRLSTLACLSLAMGFSTHAAAQVTTTLTPTADAYIQQGTPTTNYGTGTTLLVRKDSANTLTRAAYFQFDLSSVPTGTITSAVLRVYGSHDTGGTGVAIKAIGGTATGTWSETSITYNTSLTLTGADFTGTPLATTTIAPPPSAYYTWDVTSFINSRRTLGHATVGLGYTGPNTYRSTFSSREAAANKPQLVVTVNGTTEPPPPPPPPTGATWRMFGKDYNNSRVSGSQWINSSNAASLRSTTRYTGNGVSGTPLVVDNVIYNADTGGRLYARNFETGALIWSVLVPNVRLISGTPYVSDDTVYVSGEGSRLVAVNRATGAIRWTTQPLETSPNNRTWSSPVLIGNKLIFGLGSYQVFRPTTPMFRGSIIAVDINNNGAVLWRRSVCPAGACGGGVTVWSSVAVDPELRQVYIGTGQGYAEPSGPYSDSIVAINYDTGEFAWTRQLTANDIWTQASTKRQDHDVGAAPNLFTINGVKVVGVGDKGGRYTVVNRTTGAVVWQTKIGSPGALGGVMSGAAVRDDRIYTVSNSVNTSTAYCLNALTGAIVWSKPIPNAVFGAVTVANDVMLFATFNGRLHALNTANGNNLANVQIGPSAETNTSISRGDYPNGTASGPIVYRGRVLVGYGFTWNISTTGGIAVFETSRGLEPTPSP